MERHFLSTNHFLGASATQGEVFCFRCGDFVYDVEFDLARQVRDCVVCVRVCVCVFVCLWVGG
jgi:hypothetical protein